MTPAICCWGCERKSLQPGVMPNGCAGRGLAYAKFGAGFNGPYNEPVACPFGCPANCPFGCRFDWTLGGTFSCPLTVGDAGCWPKRRFSDGDCLETSFESYPPGPRTPGEGLAALLYVGVCVCEPRAPM